MIDYEARQAAIAAYRATWPEVYETVREAIDLGFWPDCYGGGPDPHGCAPPTKFYYPRAGVAHPHHVDGVAAGSAVMIWAFDTHQVGPDAIRHERIWLTAVDGYGHPLRFRRAGGALTFDEAIAWAIGIGDEMQAHYIVPDWDPVTRRPSLPLEAWRELAALPIAEKAAEAGQLSLFAEEKPRDRMSLLQDGIDAVVRTMAHMPAGTMITLDPDIIYFEQLLDRANRRRSAALQGEDS